MGGTYSKVGSSESVSKKPDFFQKTKNILDRIDQDNSKKGHFRSKSISVKPVVINYGTVKHDSTTNLIAPSDLRGSHDDPNYKLEHALSDTFPSTHGAG